MTMHKRCNSPWLEGWEAVKCNRLPIAVLWVSAVVLVVAYYTIPAVASALEPLARWQKERGILAAFLNRVVFCGLVPGVFIVLLKALRPKQCSPY